MHNHKIIHFEIPSKDPNRAMNFYSNILGWSFQAWEGPMDYWFTKAGPKNAPGIEGAITKKESEDDIVINTIGVSDIDNVIIKIKKHGGTIINPKHAVPGVGYLAYFKDLDNNLFGLMQEDPNAK
ncbi:MAG: VOC family protein [Candidatus Lokiarchaeota archaeon]|nr:VOC family protein [Candidatus Lokiarchaeota archaeon]